MRILIDTNIFIPLEDSEILDSDLANFDKLHRENSVQILIHPASSKDLERDVNNERKKRCLSRLIKYPQLTNPPDCSEQFRDDYNIVANSPNDQTDDALLCAVFRNAVSFLITEDKKMHQKAKKLGINERVFFLLDALEYLTKIFSIQPIILPNIQEVFVHEIATDLPTPFFDSLRRDYGEQVFDFWFKKAAQGGRKAWVCRDDNGSLGAICIYKDEENETVTKDGKGFQGKILKLCCFKVGDRVQGKKIGELFLKAAFFYATANHHETIYVTMFSSKQPFLVEMCEDFGFVYFGEKENGEAVYSKSHPVESPQNDLLPLEYHKQYSPHFKYGNSVNKFIVPIRPEYHQKLFPDCYPILQQNLFAGQVKSTPGNAIKQAYLCHSNISSLKPGDVLLFYRSGDYKEMTTIGIVEIATRLTTIEEVMERVSRRTVYNKSEIESMLVKPCLTILFRLASHLKKPLSSLDLQTLGINGSIQSIRSIKDDVFSFIIEKSGIQNCIYAD